MKLSRPKYCILLRNSATLALMVASIAAFATLGEGRKMHRDSTSNRSLLSVREPVSNYKNFTLRSGYNYRGNQLLTGAQENKYLVLDRVITYQKGNQTYILPMKKKVLLDKITFNPAQQR